MHTFTKLKNYFQNYTKKSLLHQLLRIKLLLQLMRIPESLPEIKIKLNKFKIFNFSSDLGTI